MARIEGLDGGSFVFRADYLTKQDRIAESLRRQEPIRSVWERRPEQFAEWSNMFVASAALRDLVYGDVPLADFLDRSLTTAKASPGDMNAPWQHLVDAVREKNGGNNAAAENALRSVLREPQLESRLALETWTALRSLGSHPASDVATAVLGVVVERPMEEGYDTLAVYADHRIRYFNFGGFMLFGEDTNEVHPLVDFVEPEQFAMLTERILLTTHHLMEASSYEFGSGWRPQVRTTVPPAVVRATVLTAAGNYVAEKPVATLSNDHLLAIIAKQANDLLGAMTAAKKR